MSSIYTLFPENIKSGRVVLPHHIYAFYESLSGEKVKEDTFDNIIDDANRINFTGSLAAGNDANSVDEQTFSSAFGTSNDVSTNNSFVVGQGEVNDTIDNALIFSDDSRSATIEYVRSLSTAPQDIGKSVDIDINGSSVNQVDLRVVGLESTTDGLNFYGVWNFKAVISLDGGGSRSLADSNKELLIRPDLSSPANVDVNISADQVSFTDNRSSGSSIFWTSYFNIVELDNS